VFYVFKFLMLRNITEKHDENIMIVNHFRMGETSLFCFTVDAVLSYKRFQNIAEITLLRKINNM
jgi:hypothetical protein